MKCAMLIHYEPGHTDALSEDEFRAMLGEYTALRDSGSRSGAASATAPNLSVVGV